MHHDVTAFAEEASCYIWEDAIRSVQVGSERETAHAAVRTFALAGRPEAGKGTLPIP